MPHSSHRIDVLVVAKEPDQDIDISGFEPLLASWGVDERGKTRGSKSLIAGGCERIWIDQPGRLMLYANLRGGFRVECPDCGSNVSSVFGTAHLSWKKGSARMMACPSCQRVAALEHWRLQPPGAFSRWALVFSDAKGIELTQAAHDAICGVVDSFQVIVRRP